MLEMVASRLVTRCFPTLPGVVRVEVATFHTAAGRLVIELVIEASVEPSEVEAVLVFAFTSATTLDEAFPTVVFVLLFTLAVPALTAAASEVEAVVTVLFMLDVAELISTLVAREPTVSPAPVRVRVVASQTLAGSEVMELVMVASKEPMEDEAVLVTLFTLAATEVEAVVTVVDRVPTCEFVFVFTLEVAELISTLVAREPTVSPAPVRVRVAAAQTLVGILVMELVMVARSEPIDDEAVFVTLFTLAATEVEAVVTVVESVAT